MSAALMPDSVTNVLTPTMIEAAANAPNTSGPASLASTTYEANEIACVTSVPTVVTPAPRMTVELNPPALALGDADTAHRAVHSVRIDGTVSPRDQ
jgi:hypothetical protein